MLFICHLYPQFLHLQSYLNEFQIPAPISPIIGIAVAKATDPIALAGETKSSIS